jgi:hypothetical protein
MILKSVLPVILVSFVMAFLYKASQKKPKKDGLGNIILQLPKLYYIIGVLSIVGGIGILIFVLFFTDENEIILAYLGCLSFVFIGFLLFAKGYISHIKITDLAIIETTMFGKKKEIKWNEIKDLSFGKVSLELKISSSDKNIKAHLHLIGFQELTAKLEQKTGKNKAEIGIPN